MGFPQGLTASKSVGKPRTFGDECVGRVLRLNVSGYENVCSSSRAESPKKIASLSGAAAGLLQSFITSFAGSVSHKSLPQARYRLAPM